MLSDKESFKAQHCFETLKNLDETNTHDCFRWKITAIKLQTSSKRNNFEEATA